MKRGEEVLDSKGIRLDRMKQSDRGFSPAKFDPGLVSSKWGTPSNYGERSW